MAPGSRGCGNVPGKIFPPLNPRKKNMERRSLSGLALDHDDALVTFHDAENHRETETRSRTILLGGKQGVEDPPGGSPVPCRGRCHSQSASHKVRVGGPKMLSQPGKPFPRPPDAHREDPHTISHGMSCVSA